MTSPTIITDTREKKPLEFLNLPSEAGTLQSGEIGTNGPCPELSPKLAAEIERDIAGTGKETKEPTMKKRMQRAESIGVLRKASVGTWRLNPSGQSGHNRDNQDKSRAGIGTGTQPPLYIGGRVPTVPNDSGEGAKDE